MNKALWEVLDKIKIDAIEDTYEFCDAVEAEFGNEYEVEVWNWDDYEASQLANSIVEWIADHSKGKELIDLQSETKWTETEDACFTVVVLRTK